MNKSGIIKFSDFFEKENIVNESIHIDEEDENISMDIDDEEDENVSMDIDDEGDENVASGFSEEDEDIDENVEVKIEEPIIESSDYYLVYKDKSEDFSCDIQLEGSNINDAKVRLILESNDWTLMFNGDIDNKGRCVIPIKKLGILNEGLVGKIRLEVIADDTIFTPWEDDFKVKVSKKVSVKVHESKSYRKSEKSEIKVNVRK